MADSAVHTGEAFVGSTGLSGTIEDFTALGDVVNTCEARGGGPCG